ETHLLSLYQGTPTDWRLGIPRPMRLQKETRDGQDIWRLDSSLTGHGVGCCLGVPLMGQGAILGVLLVGGGGCCDAFDQDSLQIARHLSLVASAALARDAGIKPNVARLDPVTGIPSI